MKPKTKALSSIMQTVLKMTGINIPRSYLAKKRLSVPLKDLYFISDGEFVKIGKAIDAASRLRELQVGNPKTLKILVVTPYAQELEKYYHKQFKEYRVRGEWFRLAPEIQCLIDTFDSINMEDEQLFKKFTPAIEAYLSTIYET